MPASPDTNGSAIVWFRDDLPITDNPALDASVRRGPPVVTF